MKTSTSATLISAALLAATVSPSAARAQSDAGGELHAIVYTSKATRPEADTWLGYWKYPLNNRMITELMRPSKGFPRVVSGEEVPGLEPGFHVVLGYCTSGELDARLKLLQAFYPDMRAPKVTGAQPPACPELENAARLVAAHRLTAPGKWISVAAVVFDPERGEGLGAPPATPDPWRGRVRVYAALFTEENGFHQYEHVDDCANMVDLERGGPSCKVSFSAGKSRVVVKTDFHLTKNVTCASGPHVQVSETTVGFGPKNQLRLDERLLEQVVDDLSCGH